MYYYEQKRMWWHMWNCKRYFDIDAKIELDKSFDETIIEDISKMILKNM
jgi:hypothetical protein